ncbi:uncharacterized protein LOC119766156 [Culex quinquefasciatus]|uniref:uncharacterized protein LOC119766156 n=1 Tax=Culex quinquefasciatus TaxID=7176 RepID=UPI0018E2AFF8|nr:uncharacterized protein LOC119766156 [Culex quinquefasciatus]
MSQITTATSGVTVLSTAPRAGRDERQKSKEKGFVNAHSEQEETSDGEGRDQPKERLNVVNKIETHKACPACGVEGHSAKDCIQFKDLSLDDRWKVVKAKKLCRRCLTPHSRWPTSTYRADERHGHDSPPAKSDDPRILPVTLYGARGQVDTFAFLDDGSSVTLVERSIANKLGIAGEDSSLCIHWTGGIKKNISNTQLVDLEISGVNNTNRLKAKVVYTVEGLGLPDQSMNFEAMAAKYDYLRSLPVQNLMSAVPGVLIGLNNLHLMPPLKLREGREGEPIATKTRLGWAVYGAIPGREAPFLHRQMHIHGSPTGDELHEYVRSFFAVESLGVIAAPGAVGPDEQRAIKMLTETTKRTASGRFETGLLWRHDYIEFPDNRAMAEKRMKCLEKRLLRDPVLYDNVQKQIADFQHKGFAHKATPEELQRFDPRRTWYLPLGLVINPNKPGKVRLIWDAAAKVDGVSLNSMLLKGPDLLSPLLSVLFKFRERQVAIGGDIEAMFHQVRIREADRSAQLFYWRDSPEKPLETMVTDVAIFVRNRLPQGSKCNPDKAFINDYLDSVDTAEEAAEIALEVAEVHSRAGFHIRNWVSNNAASFYQSQEFVYDNPSEWPEPCEDMVELAPEELRPSFVFAHFVLKPTVKWERFSKWERLVRTMAYVQRFIARKLNREKKPWQVDLTREELQKAEQSLWRLAQSEEYRDEVATLNQNQRVPADQRESLERSSNIVKLCPMLDDAGVLRVSGRIQAAECVGYETKHPVILPRDHPVTTLLLEYYHRRFQHSNNETVMNEIRQNLSIPKLRVLVRLVSNNCKWCEVYKSTPVVPQMAPLPRARLSPFLRPFTFTGVDYFGPYLIKTGRRASSELTKEISLSINKELASTFTDAHTQWRFNPPAAPHMGGSWERMVRSVKAALGAIPLERKLDEESMVTMLTEAEHMVNSRPLTFIPLEGADQESLTPNHFLLMSSSGVQQPVKDPMCEGAALRNSWNQIQHALDEFWRRWSRAGAGFDEHHVVPAGRSGDPEGPVPKPVCASAGQEDPHFQEESPGRQLPAIRSAATKQRNTWYTRRGLTNSSAHHHHVHARTSCARA